MFKFFSLSLYFSSSKMKNSWKTRFFKRKIGSCFVTASFSPPQLCPISGGTLLHMPTLWWYVPTYAHPLVVRPYLCPPSGGTPLPMPLSPPLKYRQYIPIQPWAGISPSLLPGPSPTYSQGLWLASHTSHIKVLTLLYALLGVVCRGAEAEIQLFRLRSTAESGQIIFYRSQWHNLWFRLS